jgi:LmbE family N-acetylglucosaminyl deacetylase
MSEKMKPDLLGKTMIISPHDDDGLIGCGGLIQGLTIPPMIVIVTNGALGYHHLEHKEVIVDLRQKETLGAYQKIGVPPANVRFLRYPDMSLRNYQNWTALDGQEGGYQKIFKLIREYQPEVVCLPSELDFHPDHRVTFDLGWVAAFQAKESLMPDLGSPPKIKYVFCYQVWEHLDRVTHQFDLTGESAERKRVALRLFGSQVNILDELEAAGTLSYDRELFYLFRKF